MFTDKPRELPQKVALILVDEFTMMPVTSVIEPLRLANRHVEKELYQAGRSTRWTVNRLQPPTALSRWSRARSRPIDDHAYVIVCSGIDVHHHIDKRLINWLRKAARKGRDIGAVCTGAHILAEAGVLDDYSCTIHWENLPGFSEAFPEINATGSLFEIDRDRFTSAGGTSAIDMMLSLISSQHGPELASIVAETALHSPIRHHSEHQRMSLPARIGARHPKAGRHHRGDGKQSGRAAVTKHFGQTGRAIYPPTGKAVQALPRPVAETILSGAAPEEGQIPAAADGPVCDQRRTGLRFFLAFAFFEMLSGVLQPYALSRTWCAVR